MDDLSPLELWLSQRRLVVCVGAGGVGKTTTSAAIGLRAARLGRRVVVLTIDPARRLADALGLDMLDGTPRAIAGAGPGQLWAGMLDSRAAFDNLIAKVAPDEETRDRVLGNHVYRHMADTLAGSQDYMASELLHDLVDDDRWDLVVLDTAPVKNALDFLEAPGRLVRFLDERVLGWFLPARGGLWFAGPVNVVQRLLGVVFGADFVTDLGAFFSDFQGMVAGFLARHEAVLARLRAPETGFVTVAAPHPNGLDVALWFQEELGRRDLPRAGIVANQVHRVAVTDHDARGALGEAVADLGADLPPTAAAQLLARLSMAHRRLAALATAQAERLRPLRAAASPGFYVEVPRLDDDVNDLDGLDRIGDSLFGRPLKSESPR